MARFVPKLLLHAYGALGGNDHTASGARKLLRKLEESPKTAFREVSGGRARLKLMDNRIALWVLTVGIAAVGAWVFTVVDAGMPVAARRLPYGIWAISAVLLFGSLFAKRLSVTPESIRLESILGTSRVMTFKRIEGCHVEVRKVTGDGVDRIDAVVQVAVGGELVPLPIVHQDQALMICRLFEPEQRTIVDQYFADDGLERLRRKKRKKARGKPATADVGAEAEENKEENKEVKPGSNASKRRKAPIKRRVAKA